MGGPFPPPVLSRRALLGLTAFCLAVLAAYVVWPGLATVRLGLDREALAAVFGSGRAAGVRALVNSVGVSLATVAGAGVLGAGLALAQQRL